MKYPKADVADAFKQIRKYVKRGTTIYTVLRHVSDSGMSRRIDLYTIRKNRPVFLTGYVATILGYPRHKSKDGLIVGGCGMDMGYHLVHSLSCSLFCGAGYSHDDAYSLKHEWL